MNKALFFSTLTTSILLANSSNYVIPQANISTNSKVIYTKSSTTNIGSLTESNPDIFIGNSKKEDNRGIIVTAHKLFGEMRDLTEEEEEACSRALYNLSEGTGVMLF